MGQDLVWGWIDEELEALAELGLHRLAELVVETPSLVLDEDHEQVDALIPEAIALARAAKRPWLEVYFRHWHLQSRVLIRAEGETALGEAVALVEFAHREDTKGCPQATCAVQDLAACYGMVDGPGYANDRIAVTDELLEAMEPERGCFSCLTSERASALADLGRVTEALEYLDRQTLRMLDANKRRAKEHTRIKRADLLLEAGRFADALEEVEAGLADPESTTHDREILEVDRAWALVGLGRADEIGARLPNDEALRAVPGRSVRWASVIDGLVKAGIVVNDLDLGVRLRRLARVLDERGVRWDGVRLAAIDAKLALDRGALGIARRGLARGRVEGTKLRDARRDPRVDARVDEQLQALEARLAEAIAARRAEPAAEGEPKDAEAALDRLELAPPAEPTSREAASPEAAREALHARVNVLEALDLVDEARAALREALDRDPSDSSVFLRLGHQLRQEPTKAPLEALIATALARTEAKEIRTSASFLRGLRAIEERDLPAAEAHLDDVLRQEPEAKNSRFYRGRVRARRGNHAGALEDFDHLVELDYPSTELPWRRLTAATAVGEWAKVRAIAQELGMEVEAGDGPIDERWSVVKIKPASEPSRLLHALRLGPAHARIVQVSRPQEPPQRFGDVVVFFPSAIDESVPEDTERPIHTFEEEAVLSRGGCLGFELDGAHPGEEALEALDAALEALGGALQQVSGPGYVVERPEPSGEGLAEDAEVPGYHAYVAVPEHVGVAGLEDLLAQTLRGAPYPVVALWSPPSDEEG